MQAQSKVESRTHVKCRPVVMLFTESELVARTSAGLQEMTVAEAPVDDKSNNSRGEERARERERGGGEREIRLDYMRLGEDAPSVRENTQEKR